MCLWYPTLLWLCRLPVRGARYLLHVVSVMWASQAGQYLGDELVATYPKFAIDLNALITVCCRLLIIAVMGVVAYFYGHAVHVLYLSSPLFMCDWEDPEFQFVRCCTRIPVPLVACAGVRRCCACARAATADRTVRRVNTTAGEGARQCDGTPCRFRLRARRYLRSPWWHSVDTHAHASATRVSCCVRGVACPCVTHMQVVSQLKQSYKKYFLDREHLNTNENQSRTRMLVGFFRHVMGLSIAIRSLWRGRGKLKLAMRFRIKVTNWSKREFKLNRVRIEVTTQHRREKDGR